MSDNNNNTIWNKLSDLFSFNNNNNNENNHSNLMEVNNNVNFNSIDDIDGYIDEKKLN